MGKGKKAKPRKDNSARIARGAARKAANQKANIDRHFENLHFLAVRAIPAGIGRKRPSVQVRTFTRQADRFYLAQLTGESE